MNRQSVCRFFHFFNGVNMSIEKTMESILKAYKNITNLGEVVSLMHWDQRVMMPPKGLAQRADALAFVERLFHEHLSAPALVEDIATADAGSSALDDDQQACLRDIKRQVDRAVKIPSDLVEAISRHVALSNAAWEKARADSDFDHFAPFLSTMVDLRIEEAQALGFADRPYDAMIDVFEPFASEASITAVFDDLRSRLVPFVQTILSKPKKSDALIHGPDFPVDKQREFGLKVIKDFGFDLEAGRQDVSVHPFCAGTMGDVRLTTRFFANDLRPALFGMFHESGHGMYEQGFDSAKRGTPLAEYISLGIHESQSQLWESMVGRSLPFWKHYFPQLQEAFPKALGGASLQAFYEAINIIEGSLIRVEADEATYQLHVILRFEIESDLVNRRIAVKDLPEIWNKKMKDYLGVDVPNDGQGVLQDVHWCEGLFGYFPTYCLGNLYSAQFYAKAQKDLGDLDAQFERGEFAPLREWLRENIHKHGRRYTASELVERVTGEPLSAVPFMDYMQEKFGPLYDL
jgi:carboxypeptidase Taq